MKYPLRLLTVAVFAMSACKSKPVLVSDTLKEIAKPAGMNAGADKFTIDAPPGWRKADTTISNFRITYLLEPPKDGQTRANINIVTESMNGVSLKSYFDKNLESIRNSGRGFVVGATGEKEINGVTAKWAQYIRKRPGRDMDFMIFIIPENGIAYVITCTTSGGLLKQYHELFDRTINTFRIL